MLFSCHLAFFKTITMNCVQILFNPGWTYTQNWYTVRTKTHTIKLSHLTALFRLKCVYTRTTHSGISINPSMTSLQLSPPIPYISCMGLQSNNPAQSTRLNHPLRIKQIYCIAVCFLFFLLWSCSMLEGHLLAHECYSAFTEL